jgi:porin
LSRVDSGARQAFIMRSSVVLPVALVGLLSCFPLLTATAQETEASEDEKPAAGVPPGDGMLSDPDDPYNQLPLIRQRKAEKDAVFPVSPLKKAHDDSNQRRAALKEKTGFELAMNSNTLLQGLTRALPGEDQWAVATTFDLVGTWEAIRRGKPTKGQVLFQLEGRWGYGTVGPTNLGPGGLGSLGFTANIYAPYVPAFLPFRNLYWQQGGKEAGWAYRVGRITVDQIFSTSRHISPALTFQPIAGTGPFAIGLADTGWGAAGSWYPTDRIGLIGAVHDADSNRQDFVTPQGNLFTAIELGGKIAPQTDKAGYSKLTLWHTDGTSDGQAINGSLGPAGWGFMLKVENELTADGRAIGILRYGRSYDGAALYRQLAAAHWLLYDPSFFGRINNDLIGVAINWVEATQGQRGETNVEIFYRFQMVPGFDTTLSYQAIINPALNLGIDFSSAFSFRFRIVF